MQNNDQRTGYFPIKKFQDLDVLFQEKILCIIPLSSYLCSQYHESLNGMATCNNKQGAKTISRFSGKNVADFLFIS